MGVNISIMKKIYTLLTGFALSISMSMAAHLGPQILFTAHLTGAQEVPAVTTAAEGLASLYLNSTRDTLCVRVSWSGLSGAATGIHIHDGAAGSNGGVVINLTTDIQGRQVYGRITGSDLTPTLIASLLSGNTYVNLHTAANMNGEIRGQIMPEMDKGFYSFLTTAEETSPVTGSTATGFAVMKVSQDKKSLWIELIADSLTSFPGGAHIHYGAAGSAGGVIINLTSLIKDNRIAGTVAITPGLADTLMSGMAYLNLHTAMNPSGEIRGQISNLPTLGFDAVLDIDQETEPVIGSTARGVGHFHVYGGFDTLHFLIQYSGLSGAITGVHLHEENVGVSGGVVVNLTPFIDGNVISGTITGSQINEEFINALFSGGIYVNIHTNLNPAGEIRGQLYRYLREGYMVELDDAQEVATVESGGRGIGFVSVDRDQTNIQYALSITDLSGPITGAHIHTGDRGMDGGVAFNLTDAFMKTGKNDMAMGIISLVDAQHKLDLRNNKMYVNVHTDKFPNGEARGQIERNSPCGEAPELPTGIAASLQTPVEFYPNPTSGTLYVQLGEHAEANYQLMDATGRKVAEGIVANGSSIQMNTLSNGIYFLRIELGSETQTLKVQKQ